MRRGPMSSARTSKFSYASELAKFHQQYGFQSLDSYTIFPFPIFLRGNETRLGCQAKYRSTFGQTC